MWMEGQAALGFLVEGGAGGTRLSCRLWREGQVALGFHVEGGAGCTNGRR